MRYTHTFAVVTIFLGLTLGCREQEKIVTTPSMNWPPLSEFSAVTNRQATDVDVSEGRAVFVLEEGVGQPVDLVLPQYAYHLDSESNTKVPCILIQVEEAQGQKLAGVKMLPDDSIMAGFLSDFELLGTTPPSPYTE